MSGAEQTITLPLAQIDTLMPLHLVFDAAGVIQASGTLLDSLALPHTGAHLSDLLTIHRPNLQAEADVLLGTAGRRLIVDLALAEHWHDAADGPFQRLRAVVVPHDAGGGLIHMHFGTDLSKAVLRYKLSAKDFSPISDVMETLYVLESQALIRREMEALMTRLDQARADAEVEAVTDRLTGLGNRRAIDRALRSLISRPGEDGFGVMQMDLDLFKEVNDTLGHAAGDAVLVAVSNILREETRRGDHLCRLGGDEFVMLFPDCGDPLMLAKIADRILVRLQEPIPFEGQMGRISGSIGIALSADYETPDMDLLMTNSDEALYRAKNGGRARYEFHRAEHGARVAQTKGAGSVADEV